MADIELFVPHLLKWEAAAVKKGATNRELFAIAQKQGWSDKKSDKGGKTMIGVTMKTWERYCMQKGLHATVYGLRNISYDKWLDILRTYYWNTWKADKIENQSMANLLVDWVWGSGVWGIKYPQQVAGVNADGKVGPVTLAAINAGGKDLYKKLWQRRKEHFEAIASGDPTQKVNLPGWLNRLNDLHYEESATCGETVSEGKVSTQSQQTEQEREGQKVQVEPKGKSLGTFAGAVLAVVALLFCLLLSGCETQYVPVETVRTEYYNHTDSVKQVDSIFSEKETVIRELDSAAMAEYGIRLEGLQRAWLIQTKELERRISELTEQKADTVVKVDSIYVPYPVEGKVPKWEKVKLMCVGAVVSVGVTAAWLLGLAYWIRRRYKRC